VLIDVRPRSLERVDSTLVRNIQEFPASNRSTRYEAEDDQVIRLPSHLGFENLQPSGPKVASVHL
jgi:hypothetical protein